MGQGAISLIQHIHNVLPHPRNHRLEAYLIIEQLSSLRLHSIPETMVSNALEYFKEFDDLDLKCMLSGDCWSVETNLS
jgi:hypothetical protein